MLCARKTKVDENRLRHAGIEILADDDVRRLHIAMCDTGAVAGADRDEELAEHVLGHVR